MQSSKVKIPHGMKLSDPRDDHQISSLTSMASLMSRGLSPVRPEMSANRLTPSASGGRSAKEVWNLTPCSSSVCFWNSANSGPPGPLAPAK